MMQLGGTAMKDIIERVKNAIDQKFAWPGGHQLHLVMRDGACMCMKCAKDNEVLILEATADQGSSDWEAVAVDINWEDSDMCCCNCNEAIASEYTN